MSPSQSQADVVTEWVADLGTPGADGQDGEPGQDGTDGGNGGHSVLDLSNGDGSQSGADTLGGAGGNGGKGGDAIAGGATAGSGGAGGHGGDANSRITVMLNQAPPNPDHYAVDAFAQGGSGGNAGLPGNPLDGPAGDHGPAGDGGSASAHVTAGFTSDDHAFDLGSVLFAVGGDGGHVNGGSGAAGRGGDAEASVSITGREQAVVSGTILGGVGGDAQNGTANAGDGGNAVLGPAEVLTIAAGGYADLFLEIEGGEGGDSYDAGNSGRGGDAIADNQITLPKEVATSSFVRQWVLGGDAGGVQFSTPSGPEQGAAGVARSVIKVERPEGDLDITNDAIGGDGGWRDGAGGRAGDGAAGTAVSEGKLTTGETYVDAWAFGGSGGDAWNGADGGHGGAGSASAIGTGSGDVTAEAIAEGGRGGTVHSGNGAAGLGGDADSIADATSSDGFALADASAAGGRSGIRAEATRPAEPSGNAAAEATASGATFNAIARATGYEASATASGNGDSGLASASAGTEDPRPGERFHAEFVGTTVDAEFGGAGRVEAHVSAAGWTDQPIPPDRIAYSRVAHAADPIAASSPPGGGVLAGEIPAHQPQPRFHGTFGGTVTESMTAAPDVTIYNDFYFDVDEFAGQFLSFGLSDGELTEFDLFEFRIESPDTGFQQTWTWTDSDAGASAFLTDTQLALGQFSGDGDAGLYQFETRLTWRGSGPDQRFSGGFFVATAVPEPAMLWPLALIVGALAYGKSRRYDQRCRLQQRRLGRQPHRVD